jgi:aryl-alcohol dehydrogenase-like predicted oxidoreductase
MRYETFGRRTGLRVSEYALGTASFGTDGPSIGPEASRQVFEAFVAAGGTTFDTSSTTGASTRSARSSSARRTKTWRPPWPTGSTATAAG